MGTDVKRWKEEGSGKVRSVGSGREARPGEGARLVGLATARDDQGVHRAMARFTSSDSTNSQSKAICKAVLLRGEEGRGPRSW